MLLGFFWWPFFWLVWWNVCIGEQFEEPKVIGASVSLRTKERLLQVWLSDGRNDRVRTNVSNKIRHFLGLDPANVTLYYKEHIKSIKVSRRDKGILIRLWSWFLLDFKFAIFLYRMDRQWRMLRDSSSWRLANDSNTVQVLEEVNSVATKTIRREAIRVVTAIRRGTTTMEVTIKGSSVLRLIKAPTTISRTNRAQLENSSHGVGWAEPPRIIISLTMPTRRGKITSKGDLLIMWIEEGLRVSKLASLSAISGQLAKITPLKVAVEPSIDPRLSAKSDQSHYLTVILPLLQLSLILQACF